MPERASAADRGSPWSSNRFRDGQERRLDWTERILSFPVRAAAVDAFLRELKAKGSGDLNGVLATLNDPGLCRQALRHWLLAEWIVVARHSPLVALRGPRFCREITLRAFCGEVPEEAEASGQPETAPQTEEPKSDEDQ